MLSLVKDEVLRAAGAPWFDDLPTGHCCGTLDEAMKGAQRWV
jgi:hypothetical protein